MACKNCSKSKKRLKKDEHKAVVKHLEGDIKGYKKEAAEDRGMIKKLSRKSSKAKEKMGKKRSDLKFDKVLHEFDEGTLKSGSGKKVKKPKQAVAIAYSESRRAYDKKKKSKKK